MIFKSNKCAKPFIFIVTLSILLTIIYLKAVSYSEGNLVAHFVKIRSYNSKPIDKGPKTILLWNSLFDRPDWYLHAENVNESYFDNIKCPERNCFITKNRTLLNNVTQFDAIFFHVADFLAPKNYPVERSTHQLYVFVTWESPPHTRNNLPSNVFNLTLTYRLDSDIVNPYAVLVDRDSKQIVAPKNSPAWRAPDYDFQLDKEMEGVIRNKTKMIAWFSSNCDSSSDRECLVRALKKYLQVDIFGECGHLKCPKTSQHYCNSKLDTLYKFYLAFENSLCNDYVTEKFFRALNHTIIPIVYGGADYSRFAPPHSYINVEDFASVEELVNYLKFLDANPKEYQKYFWWKRYYDIDNLNPFCSACQALNNPSRREKVQYYKNIEEWWIAHQCRFKPRIKC